MNKNLITLFLVTLISLCEAGAQSLSFLSYDRKSDLFFILAWLLYLVIVYLLWKAYHYRGVGYINVIWSGLTTIFMLFIGYMFFKERLRTIEWIGIIFVIAGITLMTYDNMNNNHH